MPKDPQISIIPKPKSKAGLKVNLAIGLVSLLAIAALVCFFILREKVDDLERKSEAIGGEISDLDRKIISGPGKKVEDVASQVTDFAIVFKGHKATSQVFDFLRSICHPYVQFFSFQLDPVIGRLSLNGKTENFKILGEQVLALLSNPKIKAVEVSGLGLDAKDGKVSFSLGMALADNVFSLPLSPTTTLDYPRPTVEDNLSPIEISSDLMPSSTPTTTP